MPVVSLAAALQPLPCHALAGQKLVTQPLTLPTGSMALVLPKRPQGEWQPTQHLDNFCSNLHKCSIKKCVHGQGGLLPHAGVERSAPVSCVVASLFAVYAILTGCVHACTGWSALSSWQPTGHLQPLRVWSSRQRPTLRCPRPPVKSSKISKTFSKILSLPSKSVTYAIDSNIKHPTSPNCPPTTL